jgi:hypothetical protein
VDVVLERDAHAPRETIVLAGADGYFEGTGRATAGMRYRYRLDGEEP